MKPILILFAIALAASAQTPPTPSISVGPDAPSGSSCNRLTVGNVYVRSESAANGPINVQRCTQTAVLTYAWQPIDHYVGATLPAKCAIGDIAFDTSATAGQNVNGCTAANTWTAQGGSGSGSGTVTSVGFTGGLISVATATTTPAFTVAGTSGGIPYFSAASTWASSGALTANLPVFGGGAGAAPTVGTRSGNTTQVVTTTGAQTSGKCVEIDASGNHIASAAACGSGSSTAAARYFQGTAQGGVNAWNINYQTLVNGAYTATDATHLRSVLTVTANLALLGNSGTNSLGPWTVTPVVSTDPAIHFIVEARSTDAVNSGSMALSYACVAAGTSVDNPTPIALSAMTLATIASTKSVYESTQSVTCTGTADAPADLYVWWTPTAPSGGTLTNLRWGLVY